MAETPTDECFRSRTYIRRLADSEEPTVLIPLIGEPVEVEVPVGLVGVDVRDVPVTIELDDRAVITVRRTIYGTAL